MSESVTPAGASAEPAPGASRSALPRILLALVIVGGLVAAFVLLDVNAKLRVVLEWIEGLGPAGPLLLIAVYVLACVLSVPGSLLTLGAGVVFGVFEGYLYAAAGSVLGATAAFLVGRTIARDWVKRKLESNERFRAIDQAVARKGWRIVFLTRLSPVFPFNLQNYMYGITGVSLRDYFFASWIGMIPGTILYVYLGSAAGSLSDAAAGTTGGGSAKTALFVVGLLATLFVTIYVTRVARSALSESIGEDATAQGADA